MNTRFSESEVEYVLSDSGSLFVFVPGEPVPAGPPFADETLSPTHLSAIFYTSGTTGFPKGAITTHENFLANIETCRRTGLFPERGLRTLISVPLFHVTGCNSQFLPACETGGTSVIMPAFQVREFLKATEAERIEILASVPAIYWLAINQPDFGSFDTSSVLRVMYGGAPAPPDLIARIVEGFPSARVSNSYGLTETSSIATFLPSEYSLSRPEAVGLAAPVIDLKLESLSGDVGELLIRGANVVAGYWKKPEATAETFAGGWLRTGDLARLDSDGFVQIVDRKKDMVNRGGENVYCVEVEGAIAAHPAVFEVAVLGVPDPMMGEKVGAVVVPKPGREIEVSDVVKFAGTRLADFKVPQYMIVRSRTPAPQSGRQNPQKDPPRNRRMGQTAAMTFESLAEHLGREIAVSAWVPVSQERIDLFAEATDDRQWIHIDRHARAARESVYESTIAHGFLTLSLLSHLSNQALAVEGARMRLNYGLNRVRFPAAVRAGSSIRARFVVQELKPFAEGIDVTLLATVELKDSPKPCCVAEWIIRYYRA